LLFRAGHHQRVSLSPVSAIGDMVAPVVLMTLATIFANGLMTVAAYISDNVVALNRERMSLLRRPHGEMLDEESVPPLDRERLTQIRGEVPLMIGRFRRVRSAILTLWVGVALFVLSVAAIAAAVTVPSEGIAFVALALVIAGVAALFGAIVFVIGSAARLGDVVIKVSRNMGFPALDALALRHLWPDRDESTRAAAEAVFAARTEQSQNGAGAP
jgi:hypothetical protein